jgi:tetratricopeptide (TPR) repeat protein
MASLDPDRWRRLESLFVTAADLSPDARSAFIDRETAGDEELRRELAGMLTHASDASARIARAIDGVAGLLPERRSWIDRRLGRYRIVREIGRGGMGLVFEAVRDDAEYHKTVAIKIAPPWSDVVAIRERFRLERQILAELEHPNIARFLDGGSEDGVPYFVMEYVDGLPITQFCDRHALGLPARLALFRQVCGAVHCAHERLVVHRDLKPSNVLVSADGVPKLIDFGIAKLLDPFSGSGATATIDARWTPDYASPEQLRGRTVTTRTDVYALGLVLYELLSGERAQLADPSSPLTLERSICEAEPPPPSERAAGRFGRSWAARLRGDLDTIVMTAIRKEPERRYAAVAELSGDVQRHLEGRPIHARPSSAAYRTGKFLRRHRAGVAAAVLVMASLVAGLGAALSQARRAERRYRQVRELANTFVFDVHDRIERLSGATEARKVIVETALGYLESLRPEAGGDPALSRELAAAYLRIGDAQGSPLVANLGDAKGALASYTRALELLAPLVAGGDPQARRLYVPVTTAIANSRQDQGDAAEAAAGYARAEDVGERLVRELPPDADLLATISWTYAADARAALRGRDFPRAERASRRTLELVERALAMDPSSPALREDLGMAYNTLGQTLHLTGRLREAADLFRQAIEIREALAKHRPDDATLRRNLLVSYGNLADVLGSQPWDSLQDTEGAIAALEKATALAELGREKDPQDRRSWFDIVNARYRLGVMLKADPKRLDAALTNFAEAERLTKQLRAQDPKRLSYLQFDALLQWRTAQVLETLARPGDAARRFETARTIVEGWLTGSSAQTLGPIYVNCSAALAALRSKAGDVGAAALVGEAARVLASLPAGAVGVDAPAYRSVGAAYLTIATHTAADRPANLEAAVHHLEKSTSLLRSFDPAPEVQPRRLAELHAVEAELARARRLSR